MEHIGRYEVIGELGTGGMGTVYKCRDSRFDSFVAIKMLHSQFATVDEVVTRFKTEAIAQRKLDHPNIIDVIDFIDEDGVLAIVMEFVNGDDLDALLESANGPMQWERAVNLCSQVLSAMNYAHSFGVVHRDLKPENILVQDIGGEEFARVMDFGIAKVIGSEKLKTVAETQMGTAPYMSPQQITSAKDVDHRADIYALGVIFFEMLTGRLPFDGDTTFTIWNKACNEPAPSVLQLNRSLPEGFDAVVSKAIAKDPADRYRDCKEFREDLLRVAGSVGAGAQSASTTSTPVHSISDSHSAEPESLVAPPQQRAASAPPSEVGPAPVQRQPASAPLENPLEGLRSAPAKKKQPMVMIAGVAAAVIMMVAAGLFFFLGGSGPSDGGLESGGPEQAGKKTASLEPIAGPTEVPKAAPSSPAIAGGLNRNESAAVKPTKMPKPDRVPGSLVVNWKPWANVLVAGRPERTTPCTFDGLPAGRYEVKLAHPDFGFETRSVEVPSGKSVRLTGEFERNGTLSVNAVPWATVFVDGTSRGNTPIKLDLKPGQYKIALRNPTAGKLEAVFSVQIESGVEKKISHRF